MGKNILDWITLILIIIGGLNWGLIAINPTYDIVAKLGATVARVVEGLVGLSALYLIYFLFKE
jgi:uncharacterized protein